MNVFIVIFGVLLLVVGLSNNTKFALDTLIEGGSGYSKIPVLSFALGSVIVTLPMYTMRNRQDWQRGYMLLIIVGFLVWNYKGLDKATRDVSGFLKG